MASPSPIESFFSKAFSVPAAEPGSNSTTQEMELNSAWTKIKTSASAAVSSAKSSIAPYAAKSGINFSVAETPPSSEENTFLESAWSKMRHSASSAASNAKMNIAPLAATAGINFPANNISKAADEENLISGSTIGDIGEEVPCAMFSKLTYRERLIGAVSCMGLGLLLNIMATLALLAGKV